MTRYATSGNYWAAANRARERAAAREAEFRSALRIWSEQAGSFVILRAVHPDDERAPFPASWTWQPATRVWSHVVLSADAEQSIMAARKAIGKAAVG